MINSSILLLFQGVLPCFIKQILLQGDDTIKMFGMEYKMVTIVGILRNVEHSSTKISYDIEDLTGRITAQLWVEETDTQHPSFMLNSYVRVVGQFRPQSNNSLMVFKIHPVKDINEVNTHYLEVINARFQAEEYGRGGHDNNESKGLKEGVGAMDVDFGFEGSNGSNMSSKDTLIFNFIKSSKDDTVGIERKKIEENFPKITSSEIKNILDRLVDQGQIYSTIDANHFLGCF